MRRSKKMKKKVISIMLILAMLVPMIQPISLAVEEIQVQSNEGIETVAGETLTSGDFQYTVEGDNVTITGYTGTATDVTIPETIDGKAVTSIGNLNYTVTNIKIPKTVVNINDYIFAVIYNLESITVDNNNPQYSSENGVLFNKDKTTLIHYPMSKKDTNYTISSTVTNIANGKLRNPNLIDINVDSGNSKYSSENGVLFNKDKTTLIDYPTGKIDTTYTIPNGVRMIGNGAFKGCGKLTSINIPNGVTTVGDDAFNFCLSLENMELPNSITSIGERAFQSCHDLKTITLSQNITEIKRETFWGTGLTNIIIPDKVTNIGHYAFRDSTIKDITIPENVTSIGSASFTLLESVTILNKTVNLNGMLSFCDRLTTIKGYKNSTAQTYATEHSINFIALDEEDPTPTVTKYTVTFKDYNGNVLKTQIVEKGKSATAPSNPTRTGYTFTGWDKSFSNITADTVITAQYTKNADPTPPTPTITKYTVTFKDHDGKVLKTEEVEKGKSATAPTAPTREGYTFKSWDKAFSNITSNVTITAQYEKKAEVKPDEPNKPEQPTKPTEPEQPTKPTETRPNINIAPYLFDAKYYADNNSDVKSAFGYNEELLKNHYMTYGIKEGRQASPIFNPQYYINAYGDLKKAFGNNYESAYNHFINYGYKEGRTANKGTDTVKYIKNVPINITNYMFDAELYYSLYPDLQQAFGYNPEALKQHYLTWGVKEGRIASYVFNPIYYLNNNADVKKAFGANGYEGAYNHFINNGIHEGRTGSKYFNVTYYLSQYGDLRNAFDQNYSKALEHFITWGMNEGRIASQEFNAGNNKKRYTDLSKAYGNKWKEYYKHYAVYGEGEKRNCK